VIDFEHVTVVLATEKPAEKSAGFCFGGPIDESEREIRLHR
jgi:hypothetical protein